MNPISEKTAVTLIYPIRGEGQSTCIVNRCMAWQQVQQKWRTKDGGLLLDREPDNNRGGGWIWTGRCGLIP